MKELNKILLKDNKLDLLKLKTTRQHMAELQKQLSPFQIDCTCKTELDYFNLCIISKGLINKSKIEEAYEAISREMAEIWHDLDYKKRNEFARNALDPMKEPLLHFTVNEARIFMPFFDELMNTLYDKEVAVLQLPQFFKLYKDFKDRMIDPFLYRHLPYQTGFADVQFLGFTAQGFGIYVKEVHHIYVIDEKKNITMIPLSLHLRVNEINCQRGMQLIEAVLNNNQREIVQWCINCGQIEERAKKKCIALLAKL